MSLPFQVDAMDVRFEDFSYEYRFHPYCLGLGEPAE